MSDRDTQFQNFAKLLWEEIMKVTLEGYGKIDCGTDEKYYELLIARRAYDLVKHAFEDVDSVTIQFEEVPDMTELPKEKDASETTS